MNIFKNKCRTLALSAALLVGVGTASTSQAVMLDNIDRLGDAGLFQYYTVNNGWQTFFRVINTSEEAVSIKVRFREAANSREVLDFEVYLSPHDMWAAWTDADALGNGVPGIRTNDTSCISASVNGNNLKQGFKTTGIPGVVGADFQDAAFTGDYKDSNLPVIDRLKEGHMEVIGIAAHGKTTAFANAVRHNEQGIPSDCPTARAIFANPNLLNGGHGHDLGNVLGFNGYLIQVDKGQGGGYDPDVLSYFANRPLVDRVNSTDVEVNLDSGNNFLFGTGGIINPQEAYLERIKQQGKLMNTGAPDFNDGPQYVEGSVDAVSAWLMRDKVINEWAAAAAPGAVVSANSTQWVLTFPTKNYYVDLQNDANIKDDISPTLARTIPKTEPMGLYSQLVALAPFEEAFPLTIRGKLNGKSCEPFIMSMWNREEKFSEFVSPGPSDIPELCYEVNVLNFDAQFNGMGLDSNFSVTVPDSVLPPASNRGWARLQWTGDNAAFAGLTVGDIDEFGIESTMYGLPVTGWLFTVYNTNSSANNHAAINAHKYTRNIEYCSRIFDGEEADTERCFNRGSGFFQDTNIFGIPERSIFITPVGN